VCILLGQKCETLELGIVVSERMELTNDGNAKVSEPVQPKPPGATEMRACQVAVSGFYYASEVVVEEVAAVSEAASRPQTTKSSKCEPPSVISSAFPTRPRVFALQPPPRRIRMSSNRQKSQRCLLQPLSSPETKRGISFSVAQRGRATT
jgi:hypothetical protein